MKINDVKGVDVEKWLLRHGVGDYQINDDGTVDVNESVMISVKSGTLPIQFGTIRGNFACTQGNLKTFKGFPHTVYGNFSCARNKISSFEFSPSYVSGVYSCSQNAFATLHDIHKHIKHIGEDIHCGQQRYANAVYVDPNTGTASPTHVLGLFRIHGLKAAFVGIPKLNAIINKCLREGKNTLLCQEDLIAAGFEDFAKF